MREKLYCIYLKYGGGGGGNCKIFVTKNMFAPLCNAHVNWNVNEINENYVD